MFFFVFLLFSSFLFYISFSSTIHVKTVIFHPWSVPATAHHNLEFAREIGIDAFPALVWDVPLRMTALLDLNEFFDAFQDLGVSYDTTVRCA